MSLQGTMESLQAEIADMRCAEERSLFERVPGQTSPARAGEGAPQRARLACLPAGS